jgi:hypothetical protein
MFPRGLEDSPANGSRFDPRRAHKSLDTEVLSGAGSSLCQRSLEDGEGFADVLLRVELVVERQQHLPSFVDDESLPKNNQELVSSTSTEGDTQMGISLSLG